MRLSSALLLSTATLVGCNSTSETTSAPQTVHSLSRPNEPTVLKRPTVLPTSKEASYDGSSIPGIVNESNITIITEPQECIKLTGQKITQVLEFPKIKDTGSVTVVSNNMQLNGYFQQTGKDSQPALQAIALDTAVWDSISVTHANGETTIIIPPVCRLTDHGQAFEFRSPFHKITIEGSMNTIITAQQTENQLTVVSNNAASNTKLHGKGQSLDVIKSGSGDFIGLSFEVSEITLDNLGVGRIFLNPQTALRVAPDSSRFSKIYIPDQAYDSIVITPDPTRNDAFIPRVKTLSTFKAEQEAKYK